MSYYIRPKIIVGPLSIKNLSQYHLGKKILVITSKNVWKKFNLSSVLVKGLEEHELFVYDHLRPDAPFEDLDLILNAQKNNRPDTIIAIGGGSVIDGAKALSIAFEGIDYKDVFYGRQTMPKNKVPVIAIPSTGGTGAELSFGAIIFDRENGKKGGLRGEIIQPNGVLIDQRLHNTCPFKLKAEVGFDCLTHAIETYISKKSNPIVRIQSVNCIQTIFKHLIPACRESNPKDMEKVALSSALMGINLAYSSTCLPHRIQYIIGPLTNTSHAQGLIALYKGWTQHLLENNILELDHLAQDLGMESDEFTKKINSLKVDLEIDYSLSYLGIQKDQLEDIAKSVTGNVSADPSYESIESIINILKHAL